MLRLLKINWPVHWLLSINRHIPICYASHPSPKEEYAEYSTRISNMKKVVSYLVTVALLALASSLASAYDPSPLQDFCVAINNTNSAGTYIILLLLAVVVLLSFSFEIIKSSTHWWNYARRLYHLYHIFFPYMTCCQLLQNCLICDNNKLFFVQFLWMENFARTQHLSQPMIFSSLDSIFRET